MGPILFLMAGFAVFCAIIFAIYKMGQARARTGLLIIVVIWIILTVLMVYGIAYERSLANAGRMQQARGLVGMGYMLVLMFVNAPLGLCGLVAGLVGWTNARKIRNA